MSLEPITLQGRKVILLPLEYEHTQALFDAAEGYPEIWDYMPVRVHTLDDMEKLVSEALTSREKRNGIPFVIYDRSANRIVGSTRIHDYSAADRHIEIGWTWLSPEVWRTAINTECKYLLLRHCFEQLNCIRIQLKTDGRNRRSQQAIERLGAQKEGVLRKNRRLHDGFIRDSVYYSILAEEWEEVKKKLEKFQVTG